MSKSITDRTIALAGIYQAAYLVDQVAARGMTDSAALESSINSIFKIDAENTEEVFGHLPGIATGLSTLIKQFNAKRNTTNILITKYVINLIHLERKLLNHPELLQNISSQIERISTQVNHYHSTHEQILADLAELYKISISTLQPKILVQGNQTHLQNTENSNKIRALLLAGIRAAVLWRQCGGSRWQILLNRKVFVNEAELLMKQVRN